MPETPQPVTSHPSLLTRPLFLGIGLEVFLVLVAVLYFSQFALGVFSLPFLLVVLLCAGAFYGVRAWRRQNPYGIEAFVFGVATPARYEAQPRAGDAASTPSRAIPKNIR